MRHTITMSALLLSIIGLSVSTSRCPMYREIVPCTCRREANLYTFIACDKMTSYDQVANIFRGHLGPTDRGSLNISHSNLSDLPYRNFKELNMTIDNLKLNHNNIRVLNADTFEGLSSVLYLSLADNNLEEVPEHLWPKVPNVKTLDLGRTKIKHISESSFKDLKELDVLVLPGNQITRIERNSLPQDLQRLHIGFNNIKDLNKTLTNLWNISWLFLNNNELKTLENELPTNALQLMMIHAGSNKIEQMPQQLKTFPKLESLFLQDNKIRRLDGTLSKAKNLQRVVLDHNNIDTITEDDFTEAERLESLILNHNEITTLNNSLVNLKRLSFLNMTYNYLTEFSFQEIAGLRHVSCVDLSHNRLSKLIGPAANLVEWDIKLTELKLEHNLLESLNGALSGLSGLLRLNLSFNKLRRISPDDLIGLEQLRLLDVSHNQLTTLEETSKTFLPSLSELRASHNLLKVLDKDFHGLPVLCDADLSNNQIIALGRDLVTKTRCKIEDGVHEGTWETLKINLQDNPILCDAALPEIQSAMEVNHTRIFGVSHCPPLSEQPVTSKPNGFLGYIPETTPSAVPLPVLNNPVLTNVNGYTKLTYDTKVNDAPPAVTSNGSLYETPPIEVKNNNSNSSVVLLKRSAIIGNETRSPLVDPVKQEQQITKMAIQIQELWTRIDQLSNQNQLLLNQQFNKTVLEQTTVNLTSEVNINETAEARKP